MNNVEKKLREEGYKYWEFKDMVRIYMNDFFKYLDINGDAWSKELIINNINFSKKCPNVKKTLTNKFNIQNQIKIYYDCVNQEFAYSTRDSFYNELAQTIVDKLNEKYYSEEDDETEETLEDKKDTEIMYTDLSEEFEENSVIDYKNMKIEILKRTLVNLSNDDIEAIFGGCFVDNNDLTRRQAYKYQYIKVS